MQSTHNVIMSRMEWKIKALSVSLGGGGDPREYSGVTENDNDILTLVLTDFIHSVKFIKL